MKNLLIILLIFTSCATKKEATSITEIKKSDTLIIKEEKVIQPSGSYSLLLHEICDTITGKPKVVTQYIIRGKDSMGLVINKNNTLRLTVDSKETIISDLRYEVSKLQSELKQTKNTEIVRYKAPRWAYMTLLISVLAIFYVCNRIFKWIPFV